MQNEQYQAKPSRKMALALKRPKMPFLSWSDKTTQIVPDNDIWVETLIMPFNFEGEEARRYFTSRNTQLQVWGKSYLTFPLR